MARSTVKTKGCFEAAIGLTDAEARAIEKIAEAKGFKTTNTNNDYARATEKVLADAKAQRGAIIEQIAKLDPQAAQAYAAPAQAGNDDLDAMFDEIVAQESVIEAPKEPRAPRAPRATSDVPETGFGKTTTPRAPRTATQAAKSAAKNAASGIGNTIDALGALFSTKPGTLGSGPVFNEDTYAAAKPLFAQAVADLKASGQDIREVMQAVIRMVMAKFGGDTVAQMKPYIVKFTQDVRDGVIDIEQSNTENEAEHDGSGTQGGKDGSRGPATGDLFDTAGDGVQDKQPGELREDASTIRRGNAKSNTGNASRGTNKNAPPDYVPPTGGLKREGSWFETAKRNIDLIELAIQIESENRPATPAEQERLAKYVGFGASAIRNELFPVPPAYAKSQEPNRLIWPQYVRSDRFKPLAERIEALPREWQQSILQSSQYAHYTSEGIIRSVWSALQRIGFKGGQVFEPGMGIGSFSMLMPDAIRAESRYTGVEFDAPTALIAKLLSPQQNMLHGDFIKGKYPKNFFDVNVGNPPFSQTKIFGDPEYAKKGFMIHDFFFAKGIDLVRPGGIQVFVTSKGTMDKQTDKARKYLSERADLLGAIRLPSTAFEDNAGTSVVTDVIFLRKRLPGEVPAGESWANTATVDTPDGPVVVNEYFAKHPEMVLGQQRISGNTDDQGRRINSNGMGGEKYTVVSYDATPDELEAKFAKAIEKLPEGAYAEKQGKTEKAKDARVDFDPSVKREGVVYLAKDGTLMRVTEGVGVPLANTAKLSDKDQAWFKSYVGLRDLVQDARFAQLNDGDWEAALSKLNKAHNNFVKEHGNILDYRVLTRKSTDEEGNVVETESRIQKNRRLLREDYDQALVTSLESISEDGSIVKSPFLKGRTIGKPVSREVKSIGDALAVSLDETGSFDLVDVGRRLKLDEEETIEALGNQIYQTPDGVWQLADEYLAGDVVAKLEEAEAAARINPDLKRNVEALKEAQPEKLGPAQISAKLGASWIPESHVNAFAVEIGAGHVTFDPRTETWQVQGGNERSARMAGAEYGTAKRSPSELLEAILNSRSIKITQTIDKKTVPDQEGTTAANEMAKKIKDKFKGWVWTDTDRATELVESYNKNFNNLAPRKFDGSHLTLPGVSLRYKLHPHQLRAIWRMVQTGNTYLAHAVGAGKTIEMIAGGMEQKRLGLIKKPMYVVPNHMLEQFSNEFMELYPLANIMVADDENFSPERRKAFIASATLNNPDAIVITHDAFQRIGVKEESVAPIRDEILADLEIELSETAKGNDTRVRRGQLEQQIEAVKQRFDRIIGAGAKDSTIKFEDMGVDFVFADEAHVFRKLDFHTAQQIKGIDPNGSKRALDMYVKTRILDKRKPGRSMVFASGTPVTNTMGELYTIMRFFAGAELDKSGISTFDAWARQFGEVAPALEPNAAGKYELIERFAKFDNVPELMSRVRQFMDVLTSDNLGALVKRPNIIGGKPNLNIIPTNSDLTDYMKGELARRIDLSRAWKPSKDEPHNPDPIVAIITDGRFAAIDPRFFGGTLKEGDKSIITEMGDKVVASYHATKNDVYLDKDKNEEKIKGSTQIVFYNLGFGEQSQKNRGFNSRAAFTKRLTDGGIPRAEIAWFDDANSDAKKEAVFKAMRNGTIKVLIGSAKKMGTGVNVQKRLAVLHYQDPPWFPADVEQPHGRILRQGNQNEEIAIEWYTTKGTYQSTMWQMVGRKQRFIDQAFTGDKTLRSMDDLGEASLFEQAAAVASGDPRAIQLAGLKQDVERFTRLQAAHANEQINVRSSLNSALWQIESGQKSIRTLEKAFKAIGEKYFSFSSGSVNGRDYAKPGEFGQAIKDEFNKVAADSAMGDPVRDKQIANIGAAIKVTMDAYIGKGDKPDGTFDIYVEFGGSSYQLGNAAAMGADVDAAGLARRIFNKVNEVDTNLQRSRRELAANETDATKLRKKLGAPFEYQQEMAEKYGELKRLEAELEEEGKADPAPNPFVVNPDGSTAGEAQAAPNADAAPDTPPAAFSRATKPATGLPVSRVTAIAQAIKATWKNAPDIVVAESMDDEAIPANVRAYNQKQMSLGATGAPQGFIYGGKVYLIADQLSTPGHVVETLFHEALGHIGLRGVFGKSLDQVLNQVILARRSEVLAKAKQYGLSANNPAEMRQAAEEVLASLAQEHPNLGLVKRAIAAIRTWLRENIPQLRSLHLTDEEIVNNFILPARRFIIDGSKRGGTQAATGKSSRNGALRDANYLANVVVSEPFRNKGLRGLNIPEQRIVLNSMVMVLQDLKIRNAVVELIPVNMMNNLVGGELSSKVLLDDPSVLKHISAINSDNSVPRAADIASSLVRATAFVAAEQSFGVGERGLSGSLNTAIGAFKRHLSASMSSDADVAAKGTASLADMVGFAAESFSAASAGKIDDRHVVTPTSDGVLGDVGADTPSSPPIVRNTVRNTSDDASNPDIRFSRSASLSATANKVVDTLNSHFSHAGTMSWWHKSFGSPYNLAQKSRPFKRVFTSAQDFLNDVSFYANEAADHAPKLLPKLESWKDIGKSPISAADNKAIEAPIFEGTLLWARDEAGKPVKVTELEDRYADLSDEDKGQMLMKNRVVTEAQLKRWKASQLDIYSGAIRNRFEATYLRPGVEWTDAELKSIFNLTPEQAGLYHQFHAAVGTSLDNMAKSEMLRFGGEDVEALRDMVLDAASADDAAMLLRDHLLELADEDRGRYGILADMANGMIDRADKVNKLKKEGYAPLSRFGQYSVDVVVDGDRQYFGLFETKAEANQMAKTMRDEFGADNVESGTVAQAKFEQYKGITPESLELFGNMLGLDSTGDKAADVVFQEYLKLTKNNRSAMKRLIHRKGIAGYSTDTGRVLAAFIYSNARQTAAGLHMGEMADALQAMPKQEGQLSDYATKYAEYVKNPQEEAQAIRGLMFAQYLGGNVASAFVNFTQPMTVSFPYLSQFGGVKGAAAAIGKAMADQSKRGFEYEDGLKEALRIADEQGVTQPQSVHELQAQARGAATLRSSDGTRRGAAIAMASNAVSKFSLGWGKLFGMAEQINRRTTFIAAYRIAVEKGIANPGAFATKAVDETQFINNKGNKAVAARGAIGSTMMTFKSYSINYMELLHRMAAQGGPEGKRAVALAMVMLFLMAGAGGLPFMDDLDDLIDGIAQRMGYNFSSKKAKQEFLEHWIGKAGELFVDPVSARTFGKAGAQFVDRGITGIAGIPLDVAGRMGMGNLIPSTGVFMPKSSYWHDAAEIGGVGVDFLKRVGGGAELILGGRPVDGVLSAMPKAVSNFAQGVRMLSKGYYQDAKGAKVIDTTPTEAAFKAIGFQPQSVAKVGESNWIMQSAKNVYNLKSQAIRAQWAKGIFENDPDQVQSAREAMQAWNEKNPGQRITPNMPAIIRKVKEMRKTKEVRIADTSPKAMRAQVRRDIAESHAQ